MTMLADANDRPDFVVERLGKPEKNFVVLPLPFWKRLLDNDGLRRALVLLALGIVWQAYAVWVDNDLVFPKLSDVLVDLWKSTINGVLPARTWNSLHTLLIGYTLGIGLGIAITTAAIVTRVGNDLLATLTSMFNPLRRLRFCLSPFSGSGWGRVASSSCWRIRCCGLSRSIRIPATFQ